MSKKGRYSGILILPGRQVPVHKVEVLQVFHPGGDLGGDVDQAAIAGMKNWSIILEI